MRSLHNSFPRHAITQDNTTTHLIVKYISEVSYLKKLTINSGIFSKERNEVNGNKLAIAINRNSYKTIENLKITRSVESILHINEYTKD